MEALEVVDSYVDTDEETLVSIIKSVVRISFPISLLDLAEVPSEEVKRAEQELGKLLLSKVIAARRGRAR